MNVETLDRRIGALRSQLAALQTSSFSGERPELTAVALDELQTALEELRVTEEELRQQNDELASAREAVERERHRYQELFEFAPDGYLVTDTRGIIREANRAAAALLGIQPRFLIGKPLYNFLEATDRQALRTKLGGSERPDTAEEFEVHLKPRGGEPFDALLTVAAGRDALGDRVTLRWMMRDITVRKRSEEQIRALNAELRQRVRERTSQLEAANQSNDELLAREQTALVEAEQVRERLSGEIAVRQRTEQALRTSEERFRQLSASEVISIGFFDVTGRILDGNEALLHLFGFTYEELRAGKMRWDELTAPEWMPRTQEAIEELKTRGTFTPYEKECIRRDGSRFWGLFGGAMLGDGSEGVAFVLDISARKRLEEDRDRLLERERQKGEQLKLAVREAHHRIKNNLQAVSDLLYLQLSTGSDISPGEVLRESIERIRAISLVHDLLSQDEDVRTVDVRAVVERLVLTVLRSNGVPADSVEIDLTVPPIPLSSKKATTLALIVTELVSNAARHALSGRQGGRLLVALHHSDDSLLLRVQDDGPGLPPGFDMTTHCNVGLELVRTLVERDLYGKLTLDGDRGVDAQVWFPW